MIGFLVTVLIVFAISCLLGFVNAKNPDSTGRLKNCKNAGKCSRCVGDTCEISGGKKC